MDVKMAEATLLDIGQVLDAAGLPFFLVLGTCLGVVRDGGLIKYDADIDIGCLVEDLRGKAAEIARAFTAAGFDSHVISKPLAYPRAIGIKRNGIKADIAGFVRYKDVRFSPSSAKDYCIVYPAALVETTEDVGYLGRTWRVPSPAHTYLEKHYGAGWRKPDPRYKPTMGKARVYGFLRKALS